MNIEVQEQKFRQSLDQLAHSTTQLTNTLVSNVVESSPQLYMKTKLHLLSCIGALSQEVVELQQADNCQISRTFIGYYNMLHSNAHSDWLIFYEKEMDGS